MFLPSSATNSSTTKRTHLVVNQIVISCFVSAVSLLVSLAPVYVAAGVYPVRGFCTITVGCFVLRLSNVHPDKKFTVVQKCCDSVDLGEIVKHFLIHVHEVCCLLRVSATHRQELPSGCYISSLLLKSVSLMFREQVYKEQAQEGGGG